MLIDSYRLINVFYKYHRIMCVWKKSNQLKNVKTILIIICIIKLTYFTCMWLQFDGSMEMMNNIKWVWGGCAGW